MGGAGGCLEADALPSTNSVLKSEEVDGSLRHCRRTGGDSDGYSSTPSTLPSPAVVSWQSASPLYTRTRFRFFFEIPHHCHDVMQESQSLTSGTGQPTFIRPVSFK